MKLKIWTPVIYKLIVIGGKFQRVQQNTMEPIDTK